MKEEEALCIQAKPANARFNRDSRYELPNSRIALNKTMKGRGLIAPGARIKALPFVQPIYKSSESRD